MMSSSPNASIDTITIWTPCRCTEQRTTADGLLHHGDRCACSHARRVDPYAGRDSHTKGRNRRAHAPAVWGRRVVGDSTTEAAQAAGGVTHTYQATAAARGLVSTGRAQLAPLPHTEREHQDRTGRRPLGAASTTRTGYVSLTERNHRCYRLHMAAPRERTRKVSTRRVEIRDTPDTVGCPIQRRSTNNGCDAGTDGPVTT